MDQDEIEAIRQLKYAYFRLLDLKRFTELGELLTEDATTSYQDGELCQRGRSSVVAFLQESLGDPGIVTMHMGHHPEIVSSGEASATGTWYLEDRVIVPVADFELHGTALYRDEYTKVAAGWKISHTGYERVFEEHLTYSTGTVRSFKDSRGRTTKFSDS